MKMTIAQFQTHVYADKEKNTEVLPSLFEKAATAGADLICLPEMFWLQHIGCSRFLR